MNTDDTEHTQPDIQPDAVDDISFESLDESGDEISTRSPEEKILALKRRIRSIEKEKQDYLDGWQRQKADYVNLKKRTDDEKSELGKYAREVVISDILPVLESFDMAFSNTDAWERVDPKWRSGVEYIHKQLLEVLTNYGLKEMIPLGDIFDPQIHTAVADIQTENKEDDHKVAKVIQKGYIIGDKLIRSPKVHVFTCVEN